MNGFFHVDDYADIHAAAAAAETAGGGVVLVPPGVTVVDATVELGTRVVLRGFGKSSVIRLADSTATTATPVPVVRAKAATNYVGVEDLTIDGNKAAQSDTSYQSHGIDYTRSTTEGSGAPVYDGGLWVRGVLVYACQGTGVAAWGGATTVRVTDTDVYHCDGAGFWAKSDSAWSDVTAANNGSYGWVVTNATSVRGANIKAFGNCSRHQGSDLYVGYSSDVRLVNAQAEDSRQHGMVVASSTHVTVFGFGAYRTITDPNQDGNRCGLWVEDDGAGNLCHHLTVFGSVRGGGSAGTAYALTTRNLGDAVLVDLGVEDMVTGNWHHLSGADGGRILFNGVAV